MIFYVLGSIVIVAAGAIGLAVYFTKPNEISVADRSDVMVNCLPHLRDPTRSECEDRG